MKKLLIIAIFLPTVLFAQRSTAFWEIGGYVGGLNYLGEVTETGDVGTWVNDMRPEFGVVLKRNFNSRVNLGVEASWGRVYAADRDHGNPERDWIVDTHLGQANLVMDINFKKFGKYFKRNANTPFVKIGAGILFYTPFLNQNASYPPEYELYPGSHTTFNIQFAFGWKWRIAHQSILGLDFHYNATGTSYLEGFNLENTVGNDAFYGLRLTYTFGILHTD